MNPGIARAIFHIKTICILQKILTKSPECFIIRLFWNLSIFGTVKRFTENKAVSVFPPEGGDMYDFNTYILYQETYLYDPDSC